MIPLAPTAAAVLPALARTLGLLVLLLPIAIAAGRWVGAGGDRAAAILAGAAVAVCTVVVGGIVLSSFSGVGAVGWIATLALVDLMLLAVIMVRRHGHVRPLLHGLALKRPRAPRPLTAAISIAALALVAGSVVMSVASAHRQERRVHFTQLWMLPTAQATGESAEIGVRNFEGRTTSYRISVTAGRTTLFSAPVQLRSSRAWTTSLQLPATTPRELVTATLYRAASPSPYRVTNLWTPGG